MKLYHSIHMFLKAASSNCAYVGCLQQDGSKAYFCDPDGDGSSDSWKTASAACNSIMVDPNFPGGSNCSHRPFPDKTPLQKCPTTPYKPNPPTDDSTTYCECKESVCKTQDCSDLLKVSNKITQCCENSSVSTCGLYLDRDNGGDNICGGSNPSPGPSPSPSLPTTWTPQLKQFFVDFLTAQVNADPTTAGKISNDQITCIVNNLTQRYNPQLLKKSIRFQ